MTPFEKKCTPSTPNDPEKDLIDIARPRSKKLLEQGMASASRGRVDEAIELFKASVEVHPSSEGYTYWAWMLSFLGRYDEAIELCERAISTDPTLGNPYNDIGTYLMKKGDLDSAVPWLEKAKTAERYEPKHYPYLNLGRIYLSQCNFRKALDEFEVALRYDPMNEELRMVVQHIRQRLKPASVDAN